jgi:hypothetical protein
MSNLAQSTVGSVIGSKLTAALHAVEAPNVNGAILLLTPSLAVFPALNFLRKQTAAMLHRARLTALSANLPISPHARTFVEAARKFAAVPSTYQLLTVVRPALTSKQALCATPNHARMLTAN